MRWSKTFSDIVSLTAGVRQGGVLSPLLFSAYIDVILSELEKSNCGCFINSKCFNSFLYADDLILVSISVIDLQLLLDKCSQIFKSLDLQINASKTNCLRIGPKYRSFCNPIFLNDLALEWVKEARYLGVFIKSGLKFSCNWHSA